MTNRAGVRAIAVAVGAATAVIYGSASVGAQNGAQALDRLIGVWRLNQSLSVAPSARGRGGPRAGFGGGVAENSGGRRGGGGGGRGGRGGGGNAPISRDEAATIRALRLSASRTSSVLVIGGTPHEVAVRDYEGLQTFTTDGKKRPVEIEGVTVNAKTKWDKGTLKQQIVVGDLELTRTWQLDKNGRLLMTVKPDQGEMDDNTRPSRFVYDRQRSGAQ